MKTLNLVPKRKRWETPYVYLRYSNYGPIFGYMNIDTGKFEVNYNIKNLEIVTIIGPNIYLEKLLELTKLNEQELLKLINKNKSGQLWGYLK